MLLNNYSFIYIYKFKYTYIYTYILYIWKQWLCIHACSIRNESPDGAGAPFRHHQSEAATPFLSAAASISQTWTGHMFSHTPLFIISCIKYLISAVFFLHLNFFLHRIPVFALHGSLRRCSRQTMTCLWGLCGVSSRANVGHCGGTPVLRAAASATWMPPVKIATVCLAFSLFPSYGTITMCVCVCVCV